MHALGQVAHIDLDTEMHVTDIKNALNANLPDDCNITSLEKVENNFHSRFDAKKKVLSIPMLYWTFITFQKPVLDAS